MYNIYQLYMSRKKCHIIFLKQDIFSQRDKFGVLIYKWQEKYHSKYN